MRARLTSIVLALVALTAAAPAAQLRRGRGMSQVLDASKVPQIPGIGSWDGGNKTWERSPRESTAHIRGVNDARGLLMVLLTHDTDFGDAYEREAQNADYFLKFSVPGYAFGINVIVYALTH